MVVGAGIFGDATVMEDAGVWAGSSVAVGAVGLCVTGEGAGIVVGAGVVEDGRGSWDVDVEDGNLIAAAASAAGSGVLDDSN